MIDVSMRLYCVIGQSAHVVKILMRRLCGDSEQKVFVLCPISAKVEWKNLIQVGEFTGSTLSACMHLYLLAGK
jgi:hypothetical protein